MCDDFFDGSNPQLSGDLINSLASIKVRNIYRRCLSVGL